MSKDQTKDHPSSETKKKTNVTQESCIVLKKDEEMEFATCDTGIKKKEDDE